MDKDINEISFQSEKELKSTIDEWLRLENYESTANDYTKNNYIYIFHYLTDSNAKFLRNKMSVSVDNRTNYRKVVRSALKTDDVYNPLTLKRMKKVEIPLNLDEDVNSFSDDVLSEIDSKITDIVNAEFATPYLVVLHFDESKGPVFRMIYQTHNTNITLYEYLRHLHMIERENL